jgi:LysR family nitrogen assimilation transcriptional regulator
VDPEVTREVAIATSRNRPTVVELWGIIHTIRLEIAGIVSSGGWPGAQLLE